MALRSRPSRGRVEEADVLSRLRAAEVPLVVDVLDLEGAPSLRAVRDAVERMPETVAARAWADGNGDRFRLVSLIVAGLNSRAYAASEDALERAAIPF